MKNDMPKNAKKVFEGVIFDVWQWEQKMFDGTKEIFECIKRPGTVFVIGIIGDKIIVQTEEQPGSDNSFISLPGGRLSNREDPLRGAKREFLEETGYVSDHWKLWFKRKQRGKIIWPFFVYIAKNCVFKKRQELDNGERIMPYFINFNTFLALADNENFRIEELRLPLTRIKINKVETQKFHDLLFSK